MELKGENMIIPTIENIAEIIEKLKVLRLKETDFINKKCDVSVDELAQKLATYHIRNPLKYTGSIEELIKATAGLDATLTEPPLMEDILAGGMPTKTLAAVIPTLPMDELQRLLNKFLPEIESTEIQTDNKYQLQEIKVDLSRELERREKHKDSAAKLISTMNNCEKNRAKPKDYWPEDIKQLMDNIDILLSPYKDYLKEKGSWGKSGSGIIEMKIKSGRPADLDDVIHEFKKIKHTMEAKAKQPAVEEPTRTKQKNEPQEKGGQPHSKKPKRPKRKRKTPPELLKEARERKAAEELAKNPNMTCVKLAKILECDKSTVVRLKAWQKRKVLSSELPEGIMRRQEDDSYTVDGVARTEPDDQ